MKQLSFFIIILSMQCSIHAFTIANHTDKTLFVQLILQDNDEKLHMPYCVNNYQHINIYNLMGTKKKINVVKSMQRQLSSFEMAPNSEFNICEKLCDQLMKSQQMPLVFKCTQVAKHKKEHDLIIKTTNPRASVSIINRKNGIFFSIEQNDNCSL